MNHLKHITAPEHFQAYLQKITDNNLYGALHQNTRLLKKALVAIPKNKWSHAYAEGKWTIQQMVQHIIDAERVFLFRALWFAREAPQPLPGFDENLWAAQTAFTHRRPKDLIKEMLTLRKSTQQFFESLPKKALRYTGTVEQLPISVGALGFICAGHANHHLQILKTRYLNAPAYT